MRSSIRDVAIRAGVSVGTVSNVLNRPEVVSPATRDRVLGAITALGFVRNESARQLRAGPGGHVADARTHRHLPVPVVPHWRRRLRRAQRSGGVRHVTDRIEPSQVGRSAGRHPRPGYETAWSVTHWSVHGPDTDGKQSAEESCRLWPSPHMVRPAL